MKNNIKSLLISLIIVILTCYLGFSFIQFSSTFKAVDNLVYLLNFGYIVSIYFIILLIVKNKSLSSIITVTLCLIWGIANYYVIIYRGSPILLWDFYAINTAASVASKYSFSASNVLLKTLLVYILYISNMIYIYKNYRQQTNTKLSFRFGYCIVGCIYLLTFTNLDVLNNLNYSIDVWNQNINFNKLGSLLSLAINRRYMNVEIPKYTDNQDIDTIVTEAITTSKTDESINSEYDKQQYPAIIAIMNETWADYEEYGNIELNQQVNTILYDIDNSIVGHAYTSVYGGGTSVSEFEFLTNNTMAFLPGGSVPYQQAVTSETDSLASYLKNFNYSALAFHPGDKTAWSRDHAYPLLGFENFKNNEEMDVQAQYSRGYVTDSSDFDQIIYEYENRDTSKNFFLFNVTIQNHGGYENEDFEYTITINSDQDYPKASQYLSSVKNTNLAFYELIDYFSSVDQPVIIVMFGDHQASLETDFINQALGLNSDSSVENTFKKYRVPFIIWANYDLPDDEINDISLNYLSLYLLKYAGIEFNDYQTYLWELQDNIQALTSNGFIGSDGNFYWFGDAGQYSDYVLENQSVQYAHLFGDYFDKFSEQVANK